MAVSEQVNPPNRPESPPSNLSLDPQVKASINVLVVDDEHTLRESCATLLSSAKDI